MTYLDLIKVSYRSLIANKRRSALTMIGIVIGIAAVITIIALGNGVRNKMISEFKTSSSGEQKTEISFFNAEQNSMQGFTQADLANIKQAFSREISNADFKLETENVATSGIQMGNAVVSGNVSLLTSPLPSDMMKAGKNFTNSQLKLGQRVILVSESYAKKVYKHKQNALGTVVIIGDKSYQIQGLFKPQGYYKYGASFMLPKQAYLQGRKADRGSTLQLTIRNGQDANKVSERVVKYLKKNGQLRKEGVYQYYNEGVILKSISKTMNMITYFVTAIAGISLFIAGIGVMNMMYISVSERTQEIGIRLAVGATQTNIMWQFLMEAIMLTVGGGLIGFSLGWGLSTLISVFLPYGIHAVVTVTDFLLAFSVSTIVGVIFGILPASQASKRNLIDILR
ncbi:FtsX-like permease family protein [Ligilactobacillus agilis]|uniref:ABC transporter permease n=1 Tax=Ligilactobacillus agilis TaxID=1601 RepID=UPI001F5780ED|nr:ABC transporter permease [Ligilactobacillus agilis]UNL42605.1 FtsX-like permease family protein [Ligilactobacillus agilis]UNL58420.1 FtsX-like permease family protein [Ligilactobacillus agilis]